jgi:hypothetical protein
MNTSNAAHANTSNAHLNNPAGGAPKGQPHPQNKPQAESKPRAESKPPKEGKPH